MDSMQADTEVLIHIQGVSAKTRRYIKMLTKQSQQLESGHLYSYFSNICRHDQNKVKNGNILKWIINEF